MENDNRREQILSATARCIARSGIRGLRMSDVGREAGVSSGLLYYHFTDRDGLLAATLAYVNSAAAGPANTGPATRGRAALIDNLVAEIDDAGAVREHAIAWHEIGASAVFEAATARHLGAADHDWQTRIATHLVADGHEPARAEQIAITCIALVDGLMSRWLSARLSLEAARAALRDGLEHLIPLSR